MTPTITLDSRVVATRDQVSSSVDEDEVILNLREGAYYGLDSVGARAWRLIQEPRSVAEVCDVIEREYDVAADRCRRDLIALLGSLAERGLVEIEG